MGINGFTYLPSFISLNDLLLGKFALQRAGNILYALYVCELNGKASVQDAMEKLEQLVLYATESALKESAETWLRILRPLKYMNDS